MVHVLGAKQAAFHEMLGQARRDPSGLVVRLDPVIATRFRGHVQISPISPTYRGSKGGATLIARLHCRIEPVAVNDCSWQGGGASEADLRLPVASADVHQVSASHDFTSLSTLAFGLKPDLSEPIS